MEGKMLKLVLATVAGLALGIGAVDAGHAAGYGSLAPNAGTNVPAASATGYSSTAVGVTGDQILQAQQQLRNLGLYRGPVDGIAGPGTQRALRQFQMSNGLAVTGILDPQTMIKLIGAASTGQAARTQPSPNQADPAYSMTEVRAAQQRLRDVGLYHGAIDGVFSPQTRRAVERFQTINGLALTAALDQQTLSRLLPNAGPGIGSSIPPNPATALGGVSAGAKIP
jgi:peptidoglycan hydrolase-like protein with peptidoglycan-binding domain